MTNIGRNHQEQRMHHYAQQRLSSSTIHHYYCSTTTRHHGQGHIRTGIGTWMSSFYSTGLKIEAETVDKSCLSFVVVNTIASVFSAIPIPGMLTLHANQLPSIIYNFKPVAHAIEVSHAACKDEFRRNYQSHSRKNLCLRMSCPKLRSRLVDH